MNRTRTQGGLVAVKPIVHLLTDASCTSGVQIVSNTVSPAKVGTFKTMSDTTTKGFFSKQARGDIIMTPMESSEIFSSGSSTGHRIQGAQTCSSPVKFRVVEFTENSVLYGLTKGMGGAIPCEGLITQQQVELLMDLVSTRTWAERGKSSNANLFESIAELHKVSKLFTRLNGRVLDLIRRPTKSFSEEYLMWKFGLKPLLSDLQFVIDRSLDVFANEKDRITTRAQEKIELSKSSTFNLAVADHGTSVCTLQQGDSLIVRGTCVDDFSRNTFDTWGLSPKSLITLPWELTGYSFVADYFANIGDFLNAITPAFGYDYRGSCLSLTRDTFNTYIVDGAFTPLTGYTTLLSPKGRADSRVITKSRTALRQPSIVARHSPLFQGDVFNFSRAAVLAALVSQAASRKASQRDYSS